ncbi:transcriptional regulator GcvA [Aidingimonas halophila]|uniref:Transcriptional regulator, LysR family n=1 Tax=Aidingimonas halophila TaxID=574349 RepID=A0A1H3EPN8_9GAMM|nr:transcriptional regulator GcvA [Aidingimonas halophila]GHC31496.1 transcriptional regulator [Aidingimonas halophila]SDX80681.1 transcriptional regulator, LysR family [Aidingimonas halophila]
MVRTLPPLGTLHCFEMAARHASFARAANALNLTPAAVSQQIRQLESRLGTALFLRHARSVELTPAGQEYATTVGLALDQIAAATERIVGHHVPHRLTIATTPAFAAKWLVPRLIDFQGRHSELEVRLVTSNSLADMARQDIDVAIRYGQGKWSGLEASELMQTDLFPVCSPTLLDEPPSLTRLSALRGHVLLRLMHDEWPAWLRHMGLLEGDDLETEGWRPGPRYPDAGLMIQAALAGQGVALGQRVLVADDLATKHLVKPLDVSLPSTYGYWLVMQPGSASLPKIRAFRDWLDEAVQTWQNTNGA